IGAGNRGTVCESMAGMDPSIVASHEIVDHPMRIAVLKRTDELAGVVGCPVAISVGEVVHTGNAVGDRAIHYGKDADGNIKCIAEVREFVGGTVTICVFEYGNPVRTFSCGSRDGVLVRLRNPNASSCVESQVNGFSDVRFGCIQLNLKSLRQQEPCPFLFGCAGFCAANMFAELWPAETTFVNRLFIRACGERHNADEGQQDPGSFHTVKIGQAGLSSGNVSYRHGAEAHTVLKFRKLMQDKKGINSPGRPCQWPHPDLSYFILPCCPGGIAILQAKEAGGVV